MKRIFVLLFFLITHTSISQEEKLLKLLHKEFPSSSQIDGRWVFFDSTRIEKIETPVMNNAFPQYVFYKSEFTNYLGYHINDAVCLILYDTKKSKVLLVEPLWYGDINKKFLRKVLNKKFQDHQELMNFVQELQNLLLVGSAMSFTKNIYVNNKITFSLEYPNQNKKNKVDIWRQFEIGIAEYSIKYIKSVNPAMNEAIIID